MRNETNNQKGETMTNRQIIRLGKKLIEYRNNGTLTYARKHLRSMGITTQQQNDAMAIVSK